MNRRFLITILSILIVFSLALTSHETRHRLINGLCPNLLINASSQEFGGLRLSIRKIVPEGPAIHILFTLEWTEKGVDEPFVILTRPWVLAVFHFINVEGQSSPQTQSNWIKVSDAFCDGSCSIYVGETTLLAPADARRIVMDVNGLRTNPVIIPRKKGRSW